MSWEKRVEKFGLCARCQHQGFEDVLANGSISYLCKNCSQEEWQERRKRLQQQIERFGLCEECNSNSCKDYGEKFCRQCDKNRED